MAQLRRRKNDRNVAGEFCQRFGVAAAHRGFVTLEQVKQAMAEQIDDDMNGREHRLLGSILYDRGWLTEDQIEMVLIEIKKVL